MCVFCLICCFLEVLGGGVVSILFVWRWKSTACVGWMRRHEHTTNGRGSPPQVHDHEKTQAHKGTDGPDKRVVHEAASATAVHFVAVGIILPNK